jgi:hypothetical protein
VVCGGHVIEKWFECRWNDWILVDALESDADHHQLSGITMQNFGIFVCAVFTGITKKYPLSESGLEMSVVKL